MCGVRFVEVVDQCIVLYQKMVELRVKEIVGLTGETSADFRLLEKGDVVVCTPTQWDIISRRWRQWENVQNLGLYTRSSYLVPR